MAAKKRTGTGTRTVEWVAGIASMPAYVTGEGEPYRPELLVWMTADGLVLGVETGAPGTLLEGAAASLERTIARPLVGPPHAPEHLRVASPELAAVLRAAAPGATVTVGPTPEVDAMVEAMAASLASQGAGPTSYLTEGITEAAVAAFFRAAAAFFRAAPWRHIPADAALALSMEEVGLDGMAVTVVGQQASAYGLMLFEDLASFRALTRAARADAPPEGLPPHLAVHLGPPQEMPAPLAEEAARHGWETAATDAVPWPVAVDEDLVSRPMTADELLVAEAAALALAALATSGPELAAAWGGGAPVVRTVTVETHQGPLAVTLTAPAEAAGGRPRADGLVAALDRLEETAEELDAAEVDALSGQLAEELRASPEGRALRGEPRWARLVMQLGVRSFDATVASLGPEELAEILHTILPREGVARASEAPAIVHELRAFYGFLGRAHGLEQAGACLEVLGPEAVDGLAAALADPGEPEPTVSGRTPR